jgi:Arc/MetJ family transcription regulator
MRTTFNLNDELLEQAQRLTGMTERTALIHAGLRALIERESGRRLARLAATERSLRVAPRRRAKAAKGR